MAATAIHSLLTFSPFRRHSTPLSTSLSLSLSLSPPPLRLRLRLRAAMSPAEKPAKKKKKKKPNRRGDAELLSLSDVEILESSAAGAAGAGYDGDSAAARRSYATTMPEPPAGFVVDGQGRVLVASDSRIVTMVDPTNNFPLECIVRRVFKSSQGDQCMLLCPVDTPVLILKSTNIEGWSAVSDEEAEAILPAAAFALAKIHMHLVHSGFCYTARGGFCYNEDDIFDFRTDDGQDVDGVPTEGVEITCFHMDGAHYMIYTPADPLLFVAVKGDNGMLHIADDDLLEDSAVISAIDEETEFNALVEEEAALLDSLFGKD